MLTLGTYTSLQDPTMSSKKESSETKFWRVSARLQASEHAAISDMAIDSDVSFSVFLRGLIRLGLQVFHGQETDDLPPGLTRRDLSELIQLGVSQKPFQK